MGRGGEWNGQGIGKGRGWQEKEGEKGERIENNGSGPPHLSERGCAHGVVIQK